MRRGVWLGLLAVVVMAVGLPGCAKRGGGGGPGWGGGMALPVVGRAEGQVGGPAEAGVWVVQSGEELRGLLRDEGSAERLDRQVRWDRQVVVLVGQGMQSTGGYWVRVTGVELEERRGEPWLRVTYLANRPGPGQMVTQALTQPYSAVVVDGVSGVFGVEGEAQDVEGLVR